MSHNDDLFLTKKPFDDNNNATKQPYLSPAIIILETADVAGGIGLNESDGGISS